MYDILYAPAYPIYRRLLRDVQCVSAAVVKAGLESCYQGDNSNFFSCTSLDTFLRREGVAFRMQLPGMKISS